MKPNLSYMKQRKFIIYGLIDPISKHLRYVGKSINGLSRALQHQHAYRLQAEPYSHKTNWVEQLKKQGLEYNICIIQEFDTEELLLEAEKFWIAYFKAMGCPLTNISEGGDDGYHLTNHEKHQKLIEAGKITGNRNKGKPRSEATKQKISKTLKGYKHTEEAGFKKAHARGVKPFVDENGKVYYSQSQAARELGILAISVNMVLNQKRKSTHGHTFKYL